MKSLFKPITVNNLEIPNRIAMAPMTRMMSPDGVPGENVKEYYQRRAAGEVGLIITEGVEVSHPSSSGIRMFLVFKIKLMRVGKILLLLFMPKVEKYFLSCGM